MTFDEILSEIIEILRREQRVSYRALKRRFALDDEYLEDLKEEMIKAKRLARDEAGAVLVWGGAAAADQAVPLLLPAPLPTATAAGPASDAAERRQLTVMFCDLVGSTALSARLDPEDLRELIRSYHATCGAVIERYEGYIAQYLGDGLLVYFGYPAAHEDDAQRAVHAALAIVAALALSAENRTASAEGQGLDPLQVRIGIHSGPVVIGELGTPGRHEQIAFGETPNFAARVEAEAAPATVVISATSYALVEGLFDCQSLGIRELRGVAKPQALYRVVRANTARRRFEATVRSGLTPLIGRVEELALLRQRWAAAQDGMGQVVAVSGEAGIGKSRLVQELKDPLMRDDIVRIELRCSRYHQDSTWHPVIEHLRRVLRLEVDESAQTGFAKLEVALAGYRFAQRETISLLAALLSLPRPEHYPPLTLTPRQQREETHAALIRWLLEETERSVMFSLWEDLQWADPSTLELLQQFIAQVPTARILLVLTYRSEFMPGWAAQSYVSQITLGRLDRQQATDLVAQIAGSRALPATVIQEIVAKTDGVPLFVEEMAKMIRGANGALDGRATAVYGGFSTSLLTIPSSLQDLLAARLDRLSGDREVAQTAAALGREFSYELLRAVVPLGDTSLQAALGRLVTAEMLFQRGFAPRAHYRFKHALLQDAAYQSMLKRTRRQLHSRIAPVLQQHFPAEVEVEPERLAYHLTEAGLLDEAVGHWRQAGERAARRSANLEAINHLRKGLELVALLPTSSELRSQALALRIALGPLLVASLGNAAAEVESTYRAAFELCQTTGTDAEHFSVTFGLRSLHLVRGEVANAHELGVRLLRTAELSRDPDLLLEAHLAFGNTSFIRGEFLAARTHFEECVARYDRHRHHTHAAQYGLDPGLFSVGRLIWTLWSLGYPEQARQKIESLQNLMEDVPHPYSGAISLLHVAWGHFLRREGTDVRDYAEAAQRLCVAHQFPHLAGGAALLRGWALIEAGEQTGGLVEIQQGLATCRATGARLLMSCYTALLAEAYCKAGDYGEGLKIVADALQIAQNNGESLYAAELYRVQGELISKQPEAERSQQPAVCFQQAIEVARQQQAKSLELRATLSLARLWRQGPHSVPARELLEEIYGWFTEGFDTPDLTEARELIEELSSVS